MLLLLLPLPLPLPFTGDGHSSFDFRFSGRGGKNAVGDGDGVFELVLLLLDVLAVVVMLVFVFVALEDDDVVGRPPRPFDPPFRSLLCTCSVTVNYFIVGFIYVSEVHAVILTELLVSVKLIKSFVGWSAALRPRLARPLGVRESNSSVGESQSLIKKETKRSAIVN